MQIARFTIAYWCVLAGALLPLGCAWLAKSPGLGKPRKQGGFDNHNPRAWLARQTDWQARANAAQANTFEALPFFIGAVIIAHQLGAGGFQAVRAVEAAGQAVPQAAVADLVEQLRVAEREIACRLFDASLKRLIERLQLIEHRVFYLLELRPPYLRRRDAARNQNRTWI